MIIYELTRGLAYQGIRHPQFHWYSKTLPVFLTAAGSCALLMLPSQPALLGKDGLVAGSLGVISTLPGFYFAGLAAVATFNGLNMDAAMPSPAPTAYISVGGAKHLISLSRRQFLSYLFSYLVFLSFALCVGSLIIAAATPAIDTWRATIIVDEAGRMIWKVLRASGIVTYLAIASSILMTTLQGMFFLTERIHQP